MAIDILALGRHIEELEDRIQRLEGAVWAAQYTSSYFATNRRMLDGILSWIDDMDAYTVIGEAAVFHKIKNRLKNWETNHKKRK